MNTVKANGRVKTNMRMIGKQTNAITTHDCLLLQNDGAFGVMRLF
jgi:hypothetical protein